MTNLILDLSCNICLFRYGRWPSIRPFPIRWKVYVTLADIPSYACAFHIGPTIRDEIKKHSHFGPVPVIVESFKV